jgi:protoporphyrinogen oxidase
MSSEQADNIQDAEATTWTKNKKPDPTPEELALVRAALAFASADKAVRKHSGARAGEEYDAKVTRWRDAYAQLLQVAASYEQEGENGAG